VAVAELDWRGLKLSEFVPPYPYRLPKVPTPWQRIRLGRRNLLSAIEDQAFEYGFEWTKVLAREVFLCNTPESVQFALSTHNDSFERKSPAHRYSLAPLLGDGLFVSDGETWRQRRRIVTPIVHVTRLAEFTPNIVETAREARERWASLAPPFKIDALSEMAQLTAEIICRTLFGRQLGRERALQVVKGFSDYQRRIAQLDLPSLLGMPDWFPRLHLPGIYRSVKRIHAVLDDIIASYRARQDGEEESVIGQLLGARSEETGAPLDEQAVRNEAAVLFMAGHETTANALAWTWFILSQTPDVEAKLHAEIDAVLSGRLPTLADVPKLVYTRAILEEVLRLYPPVPLLTRETLRDETFKGRTIRKGSIIVVSPWLLHRHRKLWHKPDHFIPERFLPGSNEPISKFAYIPFSIGPRICAGMAFGLTEAILCIATLAQSFVLRLDPGHRVEVLCRLTLRPGDKLPMHLIPRTPGTSAAGARADEAAPACPFGHG
jgi:cytochrome P450